MVVAGRGERAAATKVGGRLGLNGKEIREEKPEGVEVEEKDLDWWLSRVVSQYRQSSEGGSQMQRALASAETVGAQYDTL